MGSRERKRRQASRGGLTPDRGEGAYSLTPICSLDLNLDWCGRASSKGTIRGRNPGRLINLRQIRTTWKYLFVVSPEPGKSLFPSVEYLHTLAGTHLFTGFEGIEHPSRQTSRLGVGDDNPASLYALPTKEGDASAAWKTEVLGPFGATPKESSRALGLRLAG